jgi:hypothetical protein
MPRNSTTHFSPRRRCPPFGKRFGLRRHCPCATTNQVLHAAGVKNVPKAESGRSCRESRPYRLTTNKKPFYFNHSFSLVQCLAGQVWQSVRPSRRIVRISRACWGIWTSGQSRPPLLHTAIPTAKRSTFTAVPTQWDSPVFAPLRRENRDSPRERLRVQLASRRASGYTE